MSTSDTATQNADFGLYADRDLCLAYDEACSLSARLYAAHEDNTTIEATLDLIEAEMTSRKLI